MHKILVIQLRQLGDILLTTPLVRALKEHYPAAQISFLSHAMGRMVLTGNPWLHDHLIYPLDQPWRQQWAFLRDLRQRKYDLVIDSMDNPRSALYTLLSGATHRVGFKSKRRFAYNAIVPRDLQPCYVVREKLSLLRPLGITATNAQLTLPWGGEATADLKVVNDLVTQNSLFRASSMRVILSPTHRREARQWPKISYAALADWLVSEWGAHVIWAWGPGEEAYIDETMTFCRELTYKAPPTSFRQLAALMANCDIFIGNSNGPSHIAVATNTCSLQLHGPTTASSWCPMNSMHRTAQCAESGDIKKISFNMVTATLQEMLPTLKEHIAKRQEKDIWRDWREKTNL